MRSASQHGLSFIVTFTAFRAQAVVTRAFVSPSRRISFLSRRGDGTAFQLLGNLRQVIVTLYSQE